MKDTARNLIIAMGKNPEKSMDEILLEIKKEAIEQIKESLGQDEKNLDWFEESKKFHTDLLAKLTPTK